MKFKKSFITLSALAATIYGPLIVLLLGSSVLFAAYNVPFADDYDSILWMSVEQNGLGSSLNNLLTRITQTTRPAQELIAHTSYALLGGATPIILPILTMILFISTWYLYISKVSFLDRLGPHKRALQLITGILVLLLALYLTPSPYANGVLYSYQLFFFSSAVVTYTLPLIYILLFIYLSTLSSHSSRFVRWYWRLLFVIVLSFLFTANETIAPTAVALIMFILSMGFLAHLIKGRSVKSFLRLKLVVNLLLVLLSAALSVLILLPLKSGRISHTRWGDYSTLDNLLRSAVETFGHIGTTYFTPLDIALSIMIAVLLITALRASGLNPKINYKSIALYGGALATLTIISIYCYRFLQNIAYGFTQHELPRASIVIQVLYAATMLALSVGLVGHGGSRLRKINEVYYALILIAILAISPVLITKIATRPMRQLEATIDNYNRWHSRASAVNEAVNSGESAVYMDDTRDGVSDTYVLYCSSSNIDPDSAWYNAAVQTYLGKGVKICNESER